MVVGQASLPALQIRPGRKCAPTKSDFLHATRSQLSNAMSLRPSQWPAFVFFAMQPCDVCDGICVHQRDLRAMSDGAMKSVSIRVICGLL